MNPAHTSRDYNHCMTKATEDCETVLEAGCQFGWQLRLVNRPRMVGIEVHGPYLNDYRTVRDPRITYMHEDAKVALKRLAKESPKSFDCVMFIDFLEHFDKPDAIQLLKWAEEIARRKVWMWVPEGHHPQDYDEWNMGGDAYQTHRSQWSPDDLRQLGYDVAFWPDHHRGTNCKGQPRSAGTMFALKEFL